MSYLEYHYWKNIRRDLLENFEYSKKDEIGKIKRIKIIHTSRQILENSEMLIPAMWCMELITGQKPKKIKSHNSVAVWQLRENQIIGCEITLRKKTMYHFLEKLILINISNLEKMTLSTNINNNKEYQFGIKNISNFFEIEQELDTFRQSFPNWMEFGCNILIETTCQTEEETRCLLKGFLLPIPKKDKKIKNEKTVST